MLNFPLIVFEIFAVITIASATMVVLAQNPVRAVLSLVLCFFSSSVLWLLAHAEFLALILVLVYVGAVMTLFLFVVMMMNLQKETIKLYLVRQVPILILTLFTFLGLLLIATNYNELGVQLQINAMSKADAYSNTKVLGTVLYVDYILAFEVAGALLLLSIIAAITLAHQPTRAPKTQNVREQISVRREDRVKLVSMPVEKDGEPNE